MKETTDVGLNVGPHCTLYAKYLIFKDIQMYMAEWKGFEPSRRCRLHP
jgi:hypothetical protein